MVRSLRRRYIVFHVHAPEGVGKGLIIKLIRDRTRSLSEGEFSDIRPWLVYHHDGWAILRSGHTGAGRMVSILEGLNGAALREGELGIRVVGISGTLRGAFRKYIPKELQDEKHYREERQV